MCVAVLRTWTDLFHLILFVWSPRSYLNILEFFVPAVLSWAFACAGTLFLTDTRRKLTTWTVLECYSPGHLWVLFSLCACTSFCWCRVNAWRVQNTHSLIRNTGMTVVMSQPSLSDYYHQPLLLLLLLTLPQASVGFQPWFFSVITLFFFQSLPLFIMMLKLTNGCILKWLAEFSYFSTTHLLEGGKIVRRNFVKALYSETNQWNGRIICLLSL